MNDSLSQHCPNCEAQAAEIDKLREALDLFGGEKAIEARALFDRMKVARKGTRERKSLAKRHYEAAHLARAARAALGETK